MNEKKIINEQILFLVHLQLKNIFVMFKTVILIIITL